MLSETEVRKRSRILSETDKRMAGVFKILSDVNRYRMFRLLAEQPELSVTDIAKILKISLPLTSQHLRLLTHANLVQKERAGKNIYPRLADSNPFVQAVIKTIQLAMKQ